MSGSVEKIDQLRHRVREIEREIRESEQIRKNLAVMCEMKESLGNVLVDEREISESEIVEKWMAAYESDVEFVSNCESGDNSWLEVVGDVMDEMRVRAAEKKRNENENSEIDLRSILAILDEDAENLGRFSAVLLEKFFARRPMVVKEKRVESTITEAIGESDAKIGVEVKNEKCCVETETVQSTGDHESKETKAENYIEFVIVDEENRPLGGVKSAGEGEGHDIPANIVHEDAPAEAPRSPTPPPTTNDDGVNGGVYLYTSESQPATPACVMESNSGQQSSQSTNGQIWLQVANAMIDSNDEAPPNVYEIVNMFVVNENSGVGSNWEEIDM